MCLHRLYKGFNSHTSLPLASTYTHPQAPSQSPLAINSGLSCGPPPPRAPDTMAPGFSQSVTPSYNAQPYTAMQGTYQDSTLMPTGLEYSDNVYGGGPIPEYDFSNVRAGSWGPPASQPQNHGGYTMPNLQYSSARQAEANYAVYEPATGQLPRHTMNYSSPFPSGNYTARNAQGTSPIWRLHDYWVSYAVEDELHLTIALKRSPSA